MPIEASGWIAASFHPAHPANNGSADANSAQRAIAMQPARPELAARGVLLAVIDGASSPSCPEIASAQACEALAEAYYAQDSDIHPIEALRHAVQVCAMKLDSTRVAGCDGLSVALVAAVIRDDMVYVARVGDPGVSLASDGTLIALTDNPVDFTSIYETGASLRPGDRLLLHTAAINTWLKADQLGPLLARQIPVDRVPALLQDILPATVVGAVAVYDYLHSPVAVEAAAEPAPVTTAASAPAQEVVAAESEAVATPTVPPVLAWERRRIQPTPTPGGDSAGVKPSASESSSGSGRWARRASAPAITPAEPAPVITERPPEQPANPDGFAQGLQPDAGYVSDEDSAAGHILRRGQGEQIEAVSMRRGQPNAEDMEALRNAATAAPLPTPSAETTAHADIPELIRPAVAEPVKESAHEMRPVDKPYIVTPGRVQGFGTEPVLKPSAREARTLPSVALRRGSNAAAKSRTKWMLLGILALAALVAALYLLPVQNATGGSIGNRALLALGLLKPSPTASPIPTALPTQTVAAAAAVLPAIEPSATEPSRSATPQPLPATATPAATETPTATATPAATATATAPAATETPAATATVEPTIAPTDEPPTATATRTVRRVVKRVVRRVVPRAVATKSVAAPVVNPLPSGPFAPLPPPPP